MIIKTFTILNFDTPDSSGDVFVPGCAKTIDHKEIYVLDNFRSEIPLLGIVRELKDNGTELVCTAEFEKDPTGLYPAIGFKSIGKRKRIDGLMEYTDIEIFCIGLSLNSNVDFKIKPIE